MRNPKDITATCRASIQQRTHHSWIGNFLTRSCRKCILSIFELIFKKLKIFINFLQTPKGQRGSSAASSIVLGGNLARGSRQRGNDLEWGQRVEQRDSEMARLDVGRECVQRPRGSSASQRQMGSWLDVRYLQRERPRPSESPKIVVEPRQQMADVDERYQHVSPVAHEAQL